MQLDDKKAILGWSLYDWANSAFATTIMAALFPVFFARYCNYDPNGVDDVVINWRWGLANSIAGITIAVLAPILGAIADQGTSKKKFLMFFAVMGMVMTGGLSLVAQGHWQMAFWLYIFAAIGFSGGNIFYDALIIVVASEKKLDTVSAWGYSLGYLGGGILYAINIWMASQPETFGFSGADQAVKACCISVALWWAVFSIPVFLFVKEPQKARTASTGKMITSGLSQLWQTFKKIRQSKTIFLFLIAYWLYIDGVDTVIRMSAIYGKSIEVDETVLMLAFLIVQIVGFPATIGFGFLGSKLGARRGIFVAIVFFIFIVIWGAFIRRDYEFYILAAVVGLFLGGIQALSRSFYAKIIPADKAAEFFGFYNMMGKFAVVIGPVLMSGFGLLVKSMGYSDETSIRVSITSIALLFIAGGAVFYFVSEEQGKKEAQVLTESK